MPASTAMRTGLCLLLLNAVDWANVADDAATSPLTNIYATMHDASPGLAGNQSTNESAYTSYARVAVARASGAGGWTCTGNVANPTDVIDFPEGTGGTGTATNISFGHAASGATAYLVEGALSDNMDYGLNVTPRLSTATSITFT